MVLIIITIFVIIIIIIVIIIMVLGLLAALGARIADDALRRPGGRRAGATGESMALPSHSPTPQQTLPTRNF